MKRSKFSDTQIVSILKQAKAGMPGSLRSLAPPEGGQNYISFS